MVLISFMYHGVGLNIIISTHGPHSVNGVKVRQIKGGTLLTHGTLK